MKNLTKYALIQFMPFVETGEFANVGVLLCTPKTGFWGFKLAPPRFARVTDFFKEMDKKVYQAAIKHFEEEMQLIQKQAAMYHGEKLADFFVEITRQRQSLVRFNEVRTLLCEDPEQELNTVHERFIHRDFVTKQYRENQMVAALKKQIRQLEAAPKFEERRLHVGFREFNVPLVGEVREQLRLIKPLAFDQKNATDLFEHGEKWHNRMHALVNEKILDARNILLPVEVNVDLKDERKEAYRAIISELKQEGFQVVDFAETSKILEFAASVH
jgi:hypothetical protein